MYCRTDISWLYWSRGEVSFLTHHWKMRFVSWNLLICFVVSAPLDWVYRHWRHLVWCVWV